VSLKKLTTLEDDYAKLKASLLSDLSNGEGNNGHNGPTAAFPAAIEDALSPCGPDVPFAGLEKKFLADTGRRRSTDKLESIFMTSSGDIANKGPSTVGEGEHAQPGPIRLRLDIDEPFPASPEMEFTTSYQEPATSKDESASTRKRRPSEVYTIEEVPEEEGFSPTTGDGVTSLSSRSGSSKQRQQWGEAAFERRRGVGAPDGEAHDDEGPLGMLVVGRAGGLD